MKIFIIIIVLCLTSCSSQNDNSVRNLSTLGIGLQWAGAPESLDKKPNDYFYLLQEGNVTSKRIKPEKMEKACVDSVLKSGLYAITFKASENVIDGLSYEGDGPTTRTFEIGVIELRKRNFKLEIKNCNSTPSEIEWKDCECLTYIHIPDGREKIIQIMTAFDAPR